jgi:uncharacterized damage-inducible protein DinB
MDDATCRSIIVGAPGRFTAVLTNRTGTEGHPRLDWNVAAYVAHLADSIRIWAERVATAALDPSAQVTPYDEERLGHTRGYQTLSLKGSLWALSRAVGDWQASGVLAAADVTLNHPEQGPMTVDVVRQILTHEIQHHGHDVELIIAGR